MKQSSGIFWKIKKIISLKTYNNKINTPKTSNEIQILSKIQWNGIRY